MARRLCDIHSSRRGWPAHRRVQHRLRGCDCLIPRWGGAAPRSLPTAPRLSPTRGGPLLAHTIGSRVDGLLEALWNAGGTDLLLTTGLPPQMRVDGDLFAVEDNRPLTADDTESVVAELLTPSQSAAFLTRGDYDFSFSWRDQARIRGNAFVQRNETALS